MIKKENKKENIKNSKTRNKALKTRKKTTNKKIEKNSSIIKKIPKEKYFFLCDNSHIKNLLELADKLENMSEEVFEFHTREGNDFSNWIKDVFKEFELAEKIMNCERKEMQKEIYKIISKRLW